MGRKDVTVNILSNNTIITNLKFVNTITRVLTMIIFIVGITLYFKNEKELIN
jgi:hypothetical protein